MDPISSSVVRNTHTALVCDDINREATTDNPSDEQDGAGETIHEEECIPTHDE